MCHKTVPQHEMAGAATTVLAQHKCVKGMSIFVRDAAAVASMARYLSRRFDRIFLVDMMYCASA